MSLPFAEPASYSLSSETVGELVWSVLDIFTHILLKVLKGHDFFFFFKHAYLGDSKIETSELNCCLE